MRQPVEACFGYGAARLPICAVPYPSRPALPLWAGLGYCVWELLQAPSRRSLRRAATSTGIFALFAMLAIATALTVVRLDSETGGVQIVAFQTPEPEPAELVVSQEPPPPARRPVPAPVPPPPPERSVPEPEPPKKLEVVPPLAPEAQRVVPEPRPVARPVPRRPDPATQRPELRIDALAAAPRRPEPPPEHRQPSRRAAPSLPLPAPDLAPLSRPAEFRDVARASNRTQRLRPTVASRAPAPPSFGLAAPGGESSAVAEAAPRVARARRQVARVDTGRPPIPQITAGPAALPAESLESSRATPRAPRMARRGSATSLAPGALAPPLPTAPALPSSPDPALPPLVGRTNGNASARTRRSGRASRLRGVPLGSLAACETDRREDSLKQKVIAAVTTQKECVSEAGIYRFLETRNLNAFLLSVERAESRSLGDRCTELSLVLECLNPSSR